MVKDTFNPNLCLCLALRVGSHSCVTGFNVGYIRHCIWLFDLLFH